MPPKKAAAVDETPMETDKTVEADLDKMLQDDGEPANEDGKHF
jgi:hypothetical protein